MTESVKTRLTTISAPYGREVRLDDVAYPSGMRLLRLTVREGSRYTVMEIDAATAREWVRRHARLGRFERDGMTYRLPGEAGSRRRHRARA